MTNELESIEVEESAPSLQVFQEVYAQMTGKSEKINHDFFDPHFVRFEDIEHLNRLIHDTMEQYPHCESNCNITVKYTDGKSENFSGFGRFKAQGIARPLATEQVELEYDFLLSLPQTTDPKPYKLVVGVRSSLGVLERFHQTNASEFEKTFFYELDRATGKLQIRYIDLAVARSMEACVQAWYAGLKRTTTKKTSTLTRKMAMPFSILLLASVIGLLSYFSWIQLGASTNSSSELFRSLLVTFPGILIAMMVARPVAVKASEWLKRTGPYSIVVLSEADLELETKAKKNTIWAWVKSIGSLVATLVFGIFETLLIQWLGV